MIQKEVQQTPDITQPGWADEIMNIYAQSLSLSSVCGTL